MKFKIKLIALDLDGVLWANGPEVHEACFLDALYKTTGFFMDHDDHEHNYNGLNTLTKLEKLYNLGIISTTDIGNIYHLKQIFTQDHINAIEQDSSKINLLTDLKSMGYKLACVTNCIRESATKILNNLSILQLLDFVTSNEDVVKTKPSGIPYIFTMNKMGVTPLQTLILEDSDVGIQSAINSGAYFIKVKRKEDVSLDNILNKIKEIDEN